MNAKQLALVAKIVASVILAIAAACANGVVVLDNGSARGEGGAGGVGQLGLAGTVALAGGAAGSPTCPVREPCEPRECTDPPSVPSDPLITDFADVGPAGTFVDNDTYSRPNASWWQSFYGIPYAYPEACPPGERPSDYPLTFSTEGGALTVEGTVGGYAGFGLWLGGSCAGADLSAAAGIEFTISGDAGPEGTVSFGVSPEANAQPDHCYTNIGSCQDGPACQQPFTTVEVTGDPTRVVLKWSDLIGGYPDQTPDPRAILTLDWWFDWKWTDHPEDHAYPVKVVVDEVRLVPKTPVDITLGL